MSDGLDELLVGESPPVRALRTLIRQIGPTALPVVIEGETGVGKELVAQGLHLMAGRRGRFVAFNVCALGDSMFEDALFGHVRGAFTGAATSRVGYVGEAHEGTLFLDEISGLPPAMQVKLLRVLETKEFRPVGGAVTQASDFRLVVATNESIPALVQGGQFRSDLAFRLRGITIEVPPLRQRMDDLELLAARFLRLSPSPSVIGARVLQLLRSHSWPGNVRELKQVVECASALAGGTEITVADVRAALRADVEVSAAPAVNSIERQRLEMLLEQHNWDTAAVADALAIDRATVYRRMRRAGVPTPRGRVASAPPSLPRVDVDRLEA